MNKKLLATLLCICMAMTLLPISAMAETTVTPDATTMSGTLMNLDNVQPAGYDSNSTLHPYGINKNNFMMLAQSELYLYTSHDIDSNASNHTLRWYDTFTALSQQAGNQLDMAASSTGTNADNPYSFMEAVAFDPTGSGQKDHIAFVGYRGNNTGDNNVVAYVLNTRTGNVSDVLALGTADWMRNDFEQYKAGNFFSITAGDYDGDGIDTLVCTRIWGKPDTVELKFNAGTKSLSQIGSRRTDMLHALYQTSVAGWEGSEYDTHRWQLGACLTSGDYNGDGLDDLAVISYTNNITNGEYYDTLYEPYLTVAFGVSGKTVSNMGIQYKRYLYSGSSTSGLTMSTPSIASGDIDGDGRVELIMAGYYAEVTRGAADGAQSSRKIDDDNYLYAAYMGVNNAGSLEDPTYFTVPITAGLREMQAMDDRALAPIAVECVALDGMGAAESVFIGHSLYSINGANATQLTTIDGVELGDIDYSSYGNRNCVSSITAGNFDGNNEGREQIFLTLGIKTWPDRDNYQYALYSVGKKGGGYFVNLNKPFGESEYNDDCEKRLNCIVVAADRDDDGVKAKLGKTDYYYSNPDVTAVLQAAPYFGELGSWNDFQGGTSYGYSQSYTMGSSSSHNVSFGVGVITGADALVAEVSVEAGYTMDWNSTFEKSQTTEYSTTFTAGPYDLVVLTRTPIFTYYYSLYDHVNKSWDENALRVSVPQQPMVYRLTIDQYNAYVADYNAWLSSMGDKAKEVPRLETIDDTHLNQEGNPFAYYNTSGNTDGVVPLSDHFVVGGGGGSTDFSLTTSGEKTISTETAHGFQFRTEVSGGLIVKVGAYAEMSYSSGAGTFSSKGDSKSTSCTVIDLDTTGGQSATDHYGFNWQFCTWELNLGTDNDSVPVYGYQLSGISSPTPAVTDLAVDSYDADSDTYTLQWSHPDATGRVASKGYNVYVKKDGGTLEKINGNGLITENTYSFSYTGSYSDVFIVRSMGTDDVESADSNEVIYFKGANGKSAYQIAVDNGFEGSQEEWLTSLEGSSAYEVAVEWGYTGSAQQWLDSLRGDNGVDGASAYALAVKKGYEGTEDDWLNSLIGASGEKGDPGEKGEPGDKGEPGAPGETGKSAYELAVEAGFTGTEAEWLASLRGDADNGTDGKDGVGISNVKIDSKGYLIVTLTDGTTINAGSVRRAQLDPEDILDLYTDSPFKDVLKTFWYADAVDFCYAYGLLGGTNRTTFSPNQTVTRGMMVTVLYRLEGAPAVYGTPFADVGAKAYYATAVTWASQSGVVGGYGNGRFAPDASITYEQAVTILYRYAQYRSYDAAVRGELTEYADANQVSAYAANALSWGEGNAIIAGKTGGILAPGAKLKRCELASLFYRFCLYAVD